MVAGSRKRVWFSLFVALALMGSLGGCALPDFGLASGQAPVRVKVDSVPLKIAIAAGGAVLQVVLEEFGVGIDAADLLGQIVDTGDAVRDLPPSDVPVLIVVSKSTNDVLYWQLKESVRMVRLRHQDPGAIELKVLNESPLRVELWVEEGIDEFEVDVELFE